MRTSEVITPLFFDEHGEQFTLEAALGGNASVAVFNHGEKARFYMDRAQLVAIHGWLSAYLNETRHL